MINKETCPECKKRYCKKDGSFYLLVGGHQWCGNCKEIIIYNQEIFDRYLNILCGAVTQ